jgi:hypothetical protein
MQNVFSLDSGKGSLLLDVVGGDASALRLFSRTFNLAPNGGTLGQGVQPVRASDEVKNGDPGLVVFGVQRTRAFRTNLQIQETSGQPVTVEVRGVANPPGNVSVTLVSPSTQIPLGPYEFLQLGGIVGLLGYPEGTTSARITVRVVSGSGAVTAYGSIVDSITGDPTTVPAFRLTP